EKLLDQAAHRVALASPPLREDRDGLRDDLQGERQVVGDAQFRHDWFLQFVNSTSALASFACVRPVKRFHVQRDSSYNSRINGWSPKRTTMRVFANDSRTSRSFFCPAL